MKKTLIYLAFIFTLPALNAEVNYNNNEDYFKDGVYLGIDVGSCFTNGTRTQKTFIDSPLAPNAGEMSFGELLNYNELTREKNSHEVVNSIGAVIGAHLGYLYHLSSCNNLIIAPEFYIQYNTTGNKSDDTYSLNPYINKHTMLFAFGGKLRFGKAFKDIFIYGTAGAKLGYNKFEVVDGTDKEKVIKKYKLAKAITYGIGIEKALKNCHRVRLELEKADYRTLNYTQKEAIPGENANRYHISNYSPKQLSITLGYSIPF